MQSLMSGLQGSSDEVALELLRICDDRIQQLPRKLKINYKQMKKVETTLMSQLLALEVKKADVKGLFA